jgi:tetratricopeptide (TPR) repeat protein
LQDREGALNDFSTSLELARNEGNSAATENVIRTMTREVGVKDAIAYVERQASSDPRWRLMLVALYRSDKNDAAAIQSLEMLRSDFGKLTTPQQLNALRLEGTIYLTSQPPQPEKAERAYRELLAKDPDDFTALNNLACLLAENVNPPRPQEALEFSQHAYDLMSRRGMLEPLIADTHGWVLTLLDRPEGLGVLEDVVQRSPFLEAHYHLAEAYLKREYAQEAQNQLQLAEELILDAQKKDKPIDPATVSKVSDAMTRAQDMLRQKSQAQVP